MTSNNQLIQLGNGGNSCTLSKTQFNWQENFTQPCSNPEHLTDQGNANLFANIHGRQVRYCVPQKTWFIWNGSRWEKDKTLKIMALAEDVPKVLHYLGEENADQEVYEWAMKSESTGRKNAMLNQVKSKLPILPEQLDQHKMLLGTQNKTIDLENGKPIKPRMKHYMTQQVGAIYDPHAECPEWTKFVSMIMQGDEEMVDYLQKAVGYSLTGVCDERCLFVLYGNGKNGKTTFTSTIGKLMGDYGAAIAAKSLSITSNNIIRQDLAVVKGARFVHTGETNEGGRINEAMVKHLTGGMDVVTTRFLYGREFSYTPQFKIWLSTNHKPQITGTDDGMWDRVRLVPFKYRIGVNEPELGGSELEEIYNREMPGILNWALEGVRKWKTDGLKTPGKVQSATDEHREDMDTVQTFLDHHCSSDANGRIPVKKLYDAYNEMCDRDGDTPIDKTVFGKQMKEKGYAQKRYGARSVRTWIGIAFKTNLGA